MRVLHVTYEYPGVTRNCGGGGRVTEMLVDRLTACEHACRVLTDFRDGHWATFPIRSARRVRRAISEFAPDLVHGHFALPTSPLLPWLVPADTPLVITTMGADVYDPSRFRAVRPLADAVTGQVLSRADAVVAPSHDLADRIRDKWGIAPRYIPHGIRADEWTWQPRPRPTDPTVLSVCRLVKRKQLGLGIEAAQRWRGQVDGEVTYRIIGTGPARDRLEDTYGHLDWLTFAGYVDEIQGELAAADMFLLPSEHEAFGIAIAEALASGLPTATTDTGGQTDLVGESVGATAPPSPEALASALARVHSSYRKKQSATRGYISDHFSAEKMATRYDRLYRRVTGDRRPAASQTPSANLPRPPSSSSSHRQA